MEWFRVLVIVLDIYLLGSLGSWFALHLFLWLLQRSDLFSIKDQGGLHKLEARVEHHSSLWPAQPRPGRYRQVDQTARENLETFRTVVTQIQEQWPATKPSVSTPVTFSEALLFRAWPPLLGAIQTWQQCRKMQQLLDRAERLLTELREAEERVGQIPGEMHASLCEVRAEARRIRVLLEAEVEAGTSGLEEAEQQLETINTEIEQSLDMLAGAQGREITKAVEKADELLEIAMPQLEGLAGLVEETARARNRTENVAERVERSVELAQERWESLKARGAGEPSVPRELGALRQAAQEVTQIAEKKTVQAYRRVPEDVSHFDEIFQSLSEKLDRLDQLIERSRETVKGDVQALAQAQARCDELRKKNPLLDPDKSSRLIEEATEAYIKAERQRGLGTIAGYESAIALSKEAGNHLQEATAALDEFVERSDKVRNLLDQLSSEAIGEWHERVHRLREALQVYTVHWEGGLAEKVGQAISNLEQVSLNLERTPSDVRYERSFRQTELSQALRVLSHAQSCLEQAKETIEDLEQEKKQIESLRADITDQLDTLTQETWPDIERKKEKMLPEVRERLDALRQEFIAQRHKMETPSQVDYHKAREEWLPSLKSQLEEIISTHENDMEHYQRVARETERTLQRAWIRLEKMQPYEQPLPQEDVDELGAALESWHAEVKAEAESPSGLRALVGRRAAALQERMENAQSQIREGRRRLKELSKTYQRSAKTIHNLRSSIREIQESSQWPQIAWDTEDARDTWERAVALERQSATASTLREASNQLQEAVNTAQKAKEMYGHIKNQMERALRQLDEEFRAVNKRLTRGRDRAATLQEEGASGEAEDTIEICDRGERRIEMATSASTFEDALRHLREARNTLTRL